MEKVKSHDQNKFELEKGKTEPEEISRQVAKEIDLKFGNLSEQGRPTSGPVIRIN